MVDFKFIIEYEESDAKKTVVIYSKKKYVQSLIKHYEGKGYNLLTHIDKMD